MLTFALVLTLTVAAPGAPDHADAFIADHGLTMADCLQLQAAIEPAADELAAGFMVYTSAACEVES